MNSFKSTGGQEHSAKLSIQNGIEERIMNFGKAVLQRRAEFNRLLRRLAASMEEGLDVPMSRFRRVQESKRPEINPAFVIPDESRLVRSYLP
jgi:hypothetical protein